MPNLVTYNFDNAANFTLVQAQIASTVAKLSFTTQTGLVHTADLSTATPGSGAEYAGGQIRQIDQSPANSVMAGSLVTKDLLWHKSGSTTGTLNGTPTFTGTKMSCVGAQGAYWSKTSAASETIRAMVTTPFTGGPSANINLFSSDPASGNNDRFDLTYSPSGNNLRVRVTLYNSSGTIVIPAATTIGGTIAAVLNQEYEMAAVLDSAAGTVRVFVDGTLHGTLTPGAWTRGGTALRYYMGATPSVYNNAQTLFRNPIWYGAALWTSSYTPGYSIVSTIYPDASATGLGFTYTGVGSLQAYTAFSATVANAPRFTVDSKYWNGSAWVASAGSYAQANSAADIITNIGSLAPDDAATPINVYFQAQNNQGSVSALSVTYTGQQYFGSGKVTPIQEQNAQAMSSFAISGGVIPGSTSLKFVINVDSTPKYWNGSAWVTSDLSDLQSNDAATINTNIASLSLSTNSMVVPVVLFFTSATQSTPEIASMTFGFDFGGIVADPTKCIVWGYYKDIEGNPVEGATVTFSLVRTSKVYKEAASAIIEKSKVVLTDVNGYFAANLIRSSQYEVTTQTYRITIIKEADELNTSSISEGVDITFTVPDQDNLNITGQLNQV